MRNKQKRLPFDKYHYDSLKKQSEYELISREQYDKENPIKKYEHFMQCYISYDSVLESRLSIKNMIKEYDEVIEYRKKRSSGASNQLRIKRRINLMVKFNSKCKICNEKFDSKLKKSNLQFHHVLYDGVRDIFIPEKDLPQYRNILSEVKKYPERFELLCFICHSLRGIAKQNYNKLISIIIYIESIEKT